MREGAGIGLMHAGDVADACFLALVELDLMAADSYSEAGILDWFRFRDDMLFMATSGPGFRSLYNTMEEKAEFFQLKIEDISTVRIKFLDLEICRSDTRILTLPSPKDPGLSRRLSRKSAHPWSVHVCWPRMMIGRVASLTSSTDAIEAYTLELISTFEKLVSIQRRHAIHGCEWPWISIALQHDGGEGWVFSVEDRGYLDSTH